MNKNKQTKEELFKCFKQASNYGPPSAVYNCQPGNMVCGVKKCTHLQWFYGKGQAA